MFKLEQTITEWRQQMIAGGIKSNAVLDELESHLREDIERRMRSGTPAEQAFDEAVQQVGRAEELKLEFGKIEPLRPAIGPKLMSRGCVAMGVFIVLTGMWLLFDAPIEKVGPVHQWHSAHPGLRMMRNLAMQVPLRPITQTTSAEKVLGFAWLMLVGAYVALLPRLNRNIWSGVRGWALRKTIAIACSFFFVAWVAALSLNAANVIHLYLRFAVLPNLILWPLMAAAMATVLVITRGTDEEALDFCSPAVRQCLVIAHQEAREFHHDFIGTEHVLLGLLADENTCVSKVLEKMGVRSGTVRAEIEKIVGSFPQSHLVQAQPYTPRAKKALAIAMREAKAMRRDRVDSEHVFLGLIREGSGVAALVLKKLGVNVWDAREEILRTYRR